MSMLDQDVGRRLAGLNADAAEHPAAVAPSAGQWSPHLRVMARAVLHQLSQDHPREEIDLDAVGLLCRLIAGDSLSAAAPSAAPAQPVAWVYWHPSDTTYDGPDTRRKEDVSRFTDYARAAMAAKGWRFEPLYTAPPPPADAQQALAKRVIDAAREAMNESFEAGNETMDITVHSHLAAALSLALDEFDAATAKGE